MRALDGSLSQRAQATLRDMTALVYREPETGVYILERQGHDPLEIGDTGGLAHQAIVALARAARRRQE